MILGRDYQQDTVCEYDSAIVESAYPCVAVDIHSCDARPVCDSHSVTCPWCHARLCLDCYLKHECDMEPEESEIEMERRLS